MRKREKVRERMRKKEERGKEGFFSPQAVLMMH